MPVSRCWELSESALWNSLSKTVGENADEGTASLLNVTDEYNTACLESIHNVFVDNACSHVVLKIQNNVHLFIILYAVADKNLEQTSLYT